VDVADVQVSAGDGVQCAPHDGCEDGAQQQVTAGVWEVVVAAALVGAQDGHLVGGTERDDRLAGMDARLLPGAHGAQQRCCLDWCSRSPSMSTSIAWFDSAVMTAAVRWAS
jgi:hypothetical protein